MTHNNIPFLFLLFSLSNLALLISSAEEKRSRSHHPHCPPFECGKLGPIHFPFSNTTIPECGLYKINCEDYHAPKIQLKKNGHWYQIDRISQADVVTINEKELKDSILSPHEDCKKNLESFGLPNHSPISNVSMDRSLTIFNCTRGTKIVRGDFNKCGDYDTFTIKSSNISENNSTPQNCSIVRILDYNSVEQINLYVSVSHQCRQCFWDKGICTVDRGNKFFCSTDTRNNNKLKLKIGLGLGLGIPLGALILLVVGFFLRRYLYAKKRKALLTRNITDPYLNPDPEAGSDYYGIPLFPYKDLQEATKNFDTEKELGDGGFGTVYHGVLKDSREVAVKRLYEHNYKRLEQFMNEIKILTRLRHPNLVTLYGCTSHRSRELLLVYEYVPNGTVADHLHGNRAHSSPLHWPPRLSLAIETASALAYLHASDIVHRDVKTTNILLDNDFRVKVADFGLSRLFPADVTHVSTAPQGTPGYVDPEYHQCYQLTNKSDVYSFGVVLIELISSMPAVDITRHRHEINLSNMAVTKISKRAYCELVDPLLKFDADDVARRAIIAVAELAFQCLQQDKDMRPTMEEVLDELKRIEGGGGCEAVSRPPPSPESDDICLLKTNKEEPPSSPNCVTENWPSSISTTPNISA